MSLVTFSELLNSPAPEGVYVTDTSFILGAGAGQSKDCEKKYKIALKLKDYLLKNKVGLVYTGLIKNEATHNLREVLFKTSIKGSLKRFPELIKRYTDAKDGGLKEIAKSGYIKSFEYALGKNGKELDRELQNIFFGCTYVSTEKMKPKPDWTEVSKIMATYGLDSTDAMILNFSISQNTFKGLITMDSDFRFCADVPNFEIVVPDYFKSLEGYQVLK